MTQEIRQYIEGCTVCANFSYKQAPEPLSVHEVCGRPWQNVGSDIFTINERNYLITVDYCSQFFEVDYLPDTLSATVVTKLKHHFARHGISDTLITDGGPQYTSNAFQKFSHDWQFQHLITSPGNSKANGAAEAAVKVAKRMMRKCHAAHEDPYLGLLNLRNTPTEGLELSPAQRLFGRHTKTCMPTTFNNLLLSFDNVDTKELHENRRANGRNAQYRDVNFVHWPSVNQCVYNPSHPINVNGDQQLLRDSYLPEHMRLPHMKAEEEAKSTTDSTDASTTEEIDAEA